MPQSKSPAFRNAMQATQIIQGLTSSAGPTYCVARLADELYKSGVQSSVLTLGDPPAEWPYRAPLILHSGSLERGAGISCALARDVRKLARAPGILHGNGIWRFTNILPLLLARQVPARIVVSPHGMMSPWSMQSKSPMKAPFWKLLQKPALDRSHCYHVTAPIEYEDVRRLGLRGPVAVIPYGIDMPDLRKEEKHKRILYMSRIDPKKGVDLLLQAWTELAADFPDWELVIAGPLTGSYPAAMQSLASDLAAPRVTFAGEIRGEKKRMMLATSSLFVLPTRSENFGMVVPEALAHGTPVITTSETPWREIGDRNCGWVIRLDSRELEDSLRRAMNRPLAELAEMGRAGRAWMERDYTWSRIGEMMRLTYEWLLNGGRQPEWVID